MKARYNIPRLRQKECNEIYGQAANDAAKSIISAVLYICHLRRWHKDRIIKLYEDILSIFDMPQILGRTMTDYEMIQFISGKYGIDFDRINIQFEIIPEKSNPKQPIKISRKM